MTSPKRMGQIDRNDLRLLAEIVEILAREAYPSCLDTALEALRQHSEADACEVFSVDPARKELMLTAVVSADRDALCSRERFDLGEGFPGLVVAQGESIENDDLQSDSRYLRQSVKDRGYVSYVCVPVKRQDLIVGSLHLAWKAGGIELQRWKVLLEVVAPAIATALSPATPLQAHPEIGDGDRVARPILEDLAQRFKEAAAADAATVILVSSGGTEIIGCGSTGARHLFCDHVSCHGPLDCQQKLWEGRPMVLSGPRSSWAPACRSLPAEFEEIIEVPIQAGGACRGMVVIGYEAAAPTPTTRYLARVLCVADEIGWLFPRLHQNGGASSPALSLDEGLSVTPRLRLYCLGSFDVYIDGKLVPHKAFGRSTAIEMLKILIMAQGVPVSRDALIERIWPGVSPEAGVKRFHVTIHALRSVIEPIGKPREWVHVRRQGNGYLFDRSSPCFLDLEEFHRLLALARRAEVDLRPIEEVIDLLERAVFLYRGDLFADDLFVDWCANERRTFRERHLDALVQLARLTNQQGSPGKTVSMLLAATTVDPLREDLQRLLIRSLWNAGRQSDARRQYERCITMLATELGVDPSPETRKLAELIGSHGA